MPESRSIMETREVPKLSKPDSFEIVEKVARIAKIELTDAEKKKFEKDMKGILEAFGSLDKAKTNGVEPAFQPLPVKNVLREDVVEDCLSQDEALSNTKHKENGFFKGPKVV